MEILESGKCLIFIILDYGNTGQTFSRESRKIWYALGEPVSVSSVLLILFKKIVIRTILIKAPWNWN